MILPTGQAIPALLVVQQRLRSDVLVTPVSAKGWCGMTGAQAMQYYGDNSPRSNVRA